MAHQTTFEVIIVGGSYAGLSAAMALGRSLRDVLVIDAGMPCNRQTPHSHNFITQDGESPAAIAEKANAQVSAYQTVRFLSDFVVSGAKTVAGFEIQTASGSTFSARKVVFATGITDLLPDIAGFSACWGITVIHCPYCHGYEFRKEKTGLLLNGDGAVHMAPLIHNLTHALTLFTGGKAEFTPEQEQRITQNGVEIVETPIVEIVHDEGHLHEVILADGQHRQLSALYAPRPFRQHSAIPAALGCTMAEQGHIQVDMLQKTSIDGIYACGDNANRMRSVANAVASGNMAGAAVNAALAQEAFY